MGVIIRQSIKSSIVSYAGVILGALNILWVYPKFLQADEIGLISILTSISIITASIAQLGMNGVIIKFYPYVKNEPKQLSAFISFIIVIPIIGFMLTMLLLFLTKSFLIDSFSEKSALIIDYLFALVPFTFFLMGNGIADSLARVQLRIVMPKFYKEINLKIITIALILAYYFYDLPLSFLIYGIIFGFGFSFIQTLIYLKRLNPISISFKIKDLPPKLIKESLIYGGFIILQAFSGLLVTKIDQYMIANSIGLSQSGIYTIAMYISLSIEMPKRSINLISMPVIGEALKNNRLDQVSDLYKKTSIIQLISGALLLCCVWVNIDDLFSLIPNNEVYSEGKYVVLFIGLAVILNMLGGANNEIIMMSSFYRLNLIIVVPLIVLTILNNLWLIPIYGIVGAAMATAISIFIYNLIRFALIYFKLKIHPFSFKTIIAILIAALIYFISSNLPNSSSHLVNILYKGTFITFFTVGLNYLLNTSPELNLLVKNFLKKIGLFS